MMRLCLILISALLLGGCIIQSGSGSRTADDSGLNLTDLGAIDGELRAMMRATPASDPACPGPFPAPIAVQVGGSDHEERGGPSWVTFDDPRINVGGAWTNDRFVAPCTGLYQFNYSFVRGTYYAPCSDTNTGGADDIFLHLRIFRENGTRTIAPYSTAWAGEGSGRRTSASHTAILSLAEGDEVFVFDYEDGEEQRCLRRYSLSAHRIG